VPRSLLVSHSMKLLVPALAVLFFAGCTQTVYTHRNDFSPTPRKGAWTDYYRAVEKGEKPERPPEK